MSGSCDCVFRYNSQRLADLSSRGAVPNVPVCDLETSNRRRPRSSRAVEPQQKNIVCV